MSFRNVNKANMYVCIHSTRDPKTTKSKDGCKKENKKSDIIKNRNTSWKGIVYI